MTSVPFAASDASLESAVGRLVQPEHLAEVCKNARRYGHGGCGILAGRLHVATGWPIVFLYDGTGDLPMPIHYMVKSPRGVLVDSFGACPRGLESAVAARYDVSKPLWKTVSGDAGLTDVAKSDAAAADAFLATPWMHAVLAHARG